MPTDRAVDLAAPRLDILATADDAAVRDHGVRILGVRVPALAALAVTSMQSPEPAYRHGISPAERPVAKPGQARELCMRVLALVLALDRVSRDLLLDTLAAGGSAYRAAATLFCHRDVVLERMRRLECLPRRSLSVPKDPVELALALETFHLRTALTCEPVPDLRSRG